MSCQSTGILTRNNTMQTLKSVFPTQFEPGSLADRLLSQGRQEGREEGNLAGKM